MKEIVLLKQEIEKYHPKTDQEKCDQQLTLEAIYFYGKEILFRNCKLSHLTSSGLILNESRTKVLFCFHNIYQSYGWTGGHLDGDADMLSVALKEAKEETNITNVVPLSEEIASIDILPVNGHFKKGQYVSCHLHLNITYLLIAKEDQEIKNKPDENSDVKWIPIEEINLYVTEEEMKPIYQKLVQKAIAYPF